MSLSERITVNPAQCGGRPCIRGMRIRVTDVLELLAAGLSAEDVVDELPDLEPDDVRACLQFADRRDGYDVDALVAAITLDNRHDETDWGDAVGAERRGRPQNKTTATRR